ncbi:MAG: sulfur oxidation c-type cytochrome SoxX [Gallionellaceae bacterium]
MNKKSIIGATLALSMALLANASWAVEVVTLEAKAAAIIKRDFRDKGIAKADRVIQDELQASCSKYLDNLPAKLNDKIKAQQEAVMKYPADGVYMGDWKAGEKLAQSGRGMTWSDKAEEQPGGNCYNCHRLSSKEIAYGTIGPSLLHIGKDRGNTVEIQKYIYGRIYNAKAYNPCANMPRFGHMGILGEVQIKDLVALLLDPESPVNK